MVQGETLAAVAAELAVQGLHASTVPGIPDILVTAIQPGRVDLRVRLAKALHAYGYVEDLGAVAIHSQVLEMLGALHAHYPAAHASLEAARVDLLSSA